MPIERLSPELDRLASDDQELEELGNGCEVAEGPIRWHQAGRLIFWRRLFQCLGSQCPNGYRPDRRAGTSNSCARSPDSPCGKTWETPGRHAPGARLQGALHPHRRTPLKKVPGHRLQPGLLGVGTPSPTPWPPTHPSTGGVHRTTIPEIDVPSHHPETAQQRGQEQQGNPRVRSTGIRPPPIPPGARGPSGSAALAPPVGGIHPPDGVPPPGWLLPQGETQLSTPPPELSTEDAGGGADNG